MSNKITILDSDCDPQVAKDKSLPCTAYLVEYYSSDKICYDLVMAKKTADIFDYYWDKYRGNFHKFIQSDGTLNPRMYNPSPKK